MLQIQAVFRQNKNQQAANAGLFNLERSLPKPLKIAMVAPPWIKMPPNGYGGIENVVHSLVSELSQAGHHVELYSTKDTTTPAAENHWYYEEGQYQHIAKLIYESLPVAITQVMFAVNDILEQGDFDIVHDHNGFIGPAVMAYLKDPFPPVLHTFHGPSFTNQQMFDQGLPNNRPMFKQFGNAERFYMVGVSDSLMKLAPPELLPRILPAVHNAVSIEEFQLESNKGNYFLTLARIARDKGQGLAARLCVEGGYRLKIAGLIEGTDLKTPRQVMLELANPLSRFRGNAAFRYFSDEIFPRLELDEVDYIGDVRGEQKLDLLKNAKALLFPIDWEEPFGLAPIEALACGTPVVAMRRGALPEIIEHGVNGYLADNEEEFRQYMGRVDQIDPAECRRTVRERFSSPVMAKNYLERYRQIIANHK